MGMMTKGAPMKRETVLKILLLATLAAGLSACSSGTTATGSTDLASRSTGTAVTDTTKAWITCNAGTSSAGVFDMRLAAYEEAGAIRNDITLLRLARLPSDFASSGQYFQMFRWQANTSGSLYVDPTPLSFEIWDKQTNQLVLGARTSVKWTDVQTAASGVGVSDPTTYFKRLVLKTDLRDPTAQFDAMMVVLYKTDNTSRDSGNILLPVFDANPELYATESNGVARHPSLMNLHPFKDRRGQGWTTADFKSWSNSLCASF